MADLQPAAELPPAKFTRDARGSLGTVIDSIVSLGSVISGAHVERSVLGPWAIVGSGANVSDSILFDRPHRGRSDRAPRHPRQGGRRRGGRPHRADRAEDIARGFVVTDSGVTVVGKGSHVRATAYPAPSGREGGLLVVLDADSTLIREEAIELLAEAAGSLEHVAAVTERAMRGELDFAASLRERVATLAGLPVAEVAAARSRLTPTPGVHELIDGVHAAGGRVGVVSGGPRAARPARRTARPRLLPRRTGSRSTATGSPAACSATSSTPRRSDELEEWAACILGAPLSRTIAVGDGANDLRMLDWVGAGRRVLREARGAGAGGCRDRPRRPQRRAGARRPARLTPRAPAGSRIGSRAVVLAPA